jgi:hypothetical protein
MTFKVCRFTMSVYVALAGLEKNKRKERRERRKERKN